MIAHTFDKASICNICKELLPIKEQNAENLIKLAKRLRVTF